jgi:hypothetical protein
MESRAAERQRLVDSSEKELKIGNLGSKIENAGF